MGLVNELIGLVVLGKRKIVFIWVHVGEGKRIGMFGHVEDIYIYSSLFGPSYHEPMNLLSIKFGHEPHA